MSSLNSTIHSVSASNSTQSGIFDDAVKLEEGHQELFVTKTMDISYSHQDLGKES